VSIIFKNEEYVFNEVKTELINSYGEPTTDLSHCEISENYTKWQDKALRLFELGNKIMCEKFYPQENKQVSTFFISMVGGLIWGILFFAFMGIGAGYTSFVFGICMLGGVLFGLLFWLVLLFTESKKKKRIVKTTLDNKFFQEYRRIHNISTFAFGVCQFVNKPKNAMIYLDDEKINIITNKDNVPFSIIKKDITEYKICLNSFLIKFENQSIRIFNVDHKEYLEEDLDRTLGFDNDKFTMIYGITLKALHYYDPEWVIKETNDSSLYKDDVKNIAMCLYQEPFLDIKAITRIVTNYYSCQDNTPGNIYELCRFIDDKLDDKKNEISFYM
jgi:hypothetical protein